MKTMVKVVGTGLLLTLLILPSSGYPQPSIPKEDIPVHISGFLREQIELLYATDVKERIDAVITLGNMGEEAEPAVPFLVSLLSDFEGIELQGIPGRKNVNNTVRNEAIAALVKIGKPAVGPLIEKLTYKNSGIRKLVAWGLGAIGDNRAVEPLLVVTKDEDAGVRYRAVEALEKFNDPRIVETLLVALKDKDSNVRKIAAKMLSEKGDSRIVEPAIAALKDEHPDVRYWALEGLGKFNDPRAVEPLIATLRDSNSAVRYRAVEILGAYNDPRSFEPMIALLEDPVDSVRITTLKTLVKMTGKDFGLYPDEWRKWYKETGRKKSK